MAKTKQQKEAATQQLIDSLSAAKSVVISQFSQLEVNEDSKLRSQMHENNIGYAVVKKTLLARALNDAKLDAVDLSEVRGNVTVATAEDEISAAKVIHTFSKDNEQYMIVAGYLEGNLVDKSKVSELASLPSKEQLIAQTLATINAPVSNFVGALGAIPRKLLYALNAIGETKS